MEGTELTLGMLLHRHCQPCSQNLFNVCHSTHQTFVTSGPEEVDLRASVPEGHHASAQEGHRASSRVAGLHASAHDASSVAAAGPVRNKPSARGLHHDNAGPTNPVDASHHHPNSIRGRHGLRYAVTTLAY